MGGDRVAVPGGGAGIPWLGLLSAFVG